MDRDRLRKKVLLDLIGSPWTVLPAVGGLSALLVSWGLDMGGGWLAFAGLAGVLGSFGSLATQWIYGGDKIAARAAQSLAAEEIAVAERKLDELHAKLKKDRDPRDEKCLVELRSLYKAFKSDTTWSERFSTRSAFEITNQVEKLYRGCIMSLERSWELIAAAKQMSTKDGRESALAAREELLEEVRQSVAQLGKTIDSVRTLTIGNESDRNLSQIRQELDESLEVARRVEERMQTLDKELGEGVRDKG